MSKEYPLTLAGHREMLDYPDERPLFTLTRRELETLVGWAERAQAALRDVASIMQSNQAPSVAKALREIVDELEDGE